MRITRPPTEAQWEYACRAGAWTTFCFGSDSHVLSKYAVFRSERIEPGATLLPNAWGLFDMHGNADEWCADWYASVYPKRELVDPVGNTGVQRVFRGGSHLDSPEWCRSAWRG